MKIKKLLAIGLFAISSMFALATTVTTNSVSAAFNPDTDCPATSLYKTNAAKSKGKENIKTVADCNLPKEDRQLMTVVQSIINTIVGAVGIIAVVVIVIGGILYVTSTGEAAKTKRAQQTILYGIVGLVIAILAYAIVNFVLKSVFS